MFDPGALVGGLVTGLREGVEAALIVSIVLAYLVRTGNERHAGQVWAGVLAAVALSVVLGVAVFATVGEMQPPFEQLFEATTLIVAAVVVTWMLFWMRRVAASVSGELRAAIERAVSGGGAFGLAVLAFTAIIREGTETAIFLTGQATVASQQADLGALSVLVGALAGLAIAAVLGVGFYRGTRRIDLGVFFRWTGLALIFIAAGLLSQAVHELAEIGFVPFGASVAYDLAGVLPDDAGIGQFARAIFGYSAAPEFAALAVYLGYLVAAIGLYLRPVRPIPIRAAAVAAVSATESAGAAGVSEGVSRGVSGGVSVPVEPATAKGTEPA